jgi:hypothetical protein
MRSRGVAPARARYEQAAALRRRPCPSLGPRGGRHRRHLLSARARFRRAKPMVASARLVVHGGGAPSTFRWGTDFVGRGDAVRALVELRAPVVFVGYGISDRPRVTTTTHKTSVARSSRSCRACRRICRPKRRDYYTSLQVAASRASAVPWRPSNCPRRTRIRRSRGRPAWMDRGGSVHVARCAG